MWNSIDRPRFIAWMAVCAAAWAFGVPAPASCAEGSPPDSVQADVAPVFFSSNLDTVTNDEYVSAFSLSLDDFIMTRSGYFVERRGPLGADAAFSRYGFGRRRGSVFLGPMLLNDPYDGRVPLAVVPETAVDRLVLNGLGFPPSADGGVEGILEIMEYEPQTGRPATTLNVSTGGRGVEERRVRFSSAAGPLGIDLSYDELRSDGYYFDARDSLLAYPKLGSSATRVQGLSVRGELTDSDTYSVQFRRFTHSFRGSIKDEYAEQRRSGEYGLLNARLGRFDFASYVRGYRTTTADSLTRDQTVGVAGSVALVRSPQREVRLGARYEDVLVRQTIGGAEGRDRRYEARVGLTGVESLSEASRVYWNASLAQQFDLATGLSARVGFAQRRSPRFSFALEGARNARMPTLDEQFLPTHGGPFEVSIEGNRDLGPEIGLEGSLRTSYTFSWGSNETRVSAVRMIDPVLPVLTAEDVIRPVNSAGQNLVILDNRFLAGYRLRGIKASATVGVEAALGDREGYFATVAPVRMVVVGDIGSGLFRNTSEFRVAAIYQYSGKRRSEDRDLDPYGVLDLVIELRLLSARGYMKWMNVLDQRYETASPYLMMPSTIVYGIWWTLFD